MDNLNIANEWFDIAEKDISSAKFLLDMYPIPLEIICYHCQQSSEKFLKGFLALNEHEIIKTHDLVLLNKFCMKYDIEFSSIEEDCVRLTDFSINIRYPYPLDLIESDVRIAIKDAEKIKSFVLVKAKGVKNKI